MKNLGQNLTCILIKKAISNCIIFEANIFVEVAIDVAVD